MGVCVHACANVFMNHAFDFIPIKSLLNHLRSQRIFPMFSYRSFVILNFTTSTVIHFEFIFYVFQGMDQSYHLLPLCFANSYLIISTIFVKKINLLIKPLHLFRLSSSKVRAFYTPFPFR